MHAISPPRARSPVLIHFIMQVAKELVKNGIGGENIGIITPYNSQANLIRHATCITSLEIHTIDKYQVRLEQKLEGFNIFLILITMFFLIPV
jgi:hypothetical protein